MCVSVCVCVHKITPVMTRIVLRHFNVDFIAFCPDCKVTKFTDANVNAQYVVLKNINKNTATKK